MYIYLNNCTASGLTLSEVSRVRCNQECNVMKLTNNINIFTNHFKSKLIPLQNNFNF